MQTFTPAQKRLTRGGQQPLEHCKQPSRLAHCAEITPIQPYQPPKSSNPTVASAQDIAALVASGDIDGAAQALAKAAPGAEEGGVGFVA